MTTLADVVRTAVRYLTSAGVLAPGTAHADVWADYLGWVLTGDLTTGEAVDACRELVYTWHQRQTGRDVRVADLAQRVQDARDARLDADQAQHGPLTSPAELTDQPLRVRARWLSAARYAVSTGASRPEAEQAGWEAVTVREPDNNPTTTTEESN